MVIKWMKRIKWMRVSKYILIITMTLSLVFCGFTVYGARTGNFNIYLHANEVQLGIYMKEDKSDLGSHFSVPVLDKMDDVTFDDIASKKVRDRIMTGLGSKNDENGKQYLAFSFVLGNYSNRMVNYDVELTVISSREGLGGEKVESALRVLVIKQDYNNGSVYESLTSDAEREQLFRSGKFYALAEKSEENKKPLIENTDYVTEDFISETQLFKQEEFDFEINQEVKYTLVFWIEGWDVECTNSIYSSKIKMRLDITGR